MLGPQRIGIILNVERDPGSGGVRMDQNAESSGQGSKNIIRGKSLLRKPSYTAINHGT